jgi:hypothetical protein
LGQDPFNSASPAEAGLGRASFLFLPFQYNYRPFCLLPVTRGKIQRNMPAERAGLVIGMVNYFVEVISVDHVTGNLIDAAARR